MESARLNQVISIPDSDTLQVINCFCNLNLKLGSQTIAVTKRRGEVIGRLKGISEKKKSPLTIREKRN